MGCREGWESAYLGSVRFVKSTGLSLILRQQRLEGTSTACLPSGHNSIVTTGTPQLELLQPLDGCDISTRHGRSGGHEEQVGQQGEGKDEPLGIHCRSSGVEVVG
jgi:hypothetical protein